MKWQIHTKAEIRIISEKEAVLIRNGKNLRVTLDGDGRFETCDAMPPN